MAGVGVQLVVSGSVGAEEDPVLHQAAVRRPGRLHNRERDQRRQGRRARRRVQDRLLQELHQRSQQGFDLSYY